MQDCTVRCCVWMMRLWYKCTIKYIESSKSSGVSMSIFQTKFLRKFLMLLPTDWGVCGPIANFSLIVNGEMIIFTVCELSMRVEGCFFAMGGRSIYRPLECESFVLVNFRCTPGIIFLRNEWALDFIIPLGRWKQKLTNAVTRCYEWRNVVWRRLTLSLAQV